LGESDIDMIKFFKLKVKNRLTCETYNDFRHFFGHKSNVESEWKVIYLAEVEDVWYDCCIKSCMAFTGEYVDLEHCALCNELHKDTHGKSHWCFGYIPHILRLKGLYKSKRIASLMLYRHNFEASTTSISDVFDADGYRQLLDCKVKVDGCELPHSYFSEKHDVALSVFVDTYTVFH
ncbi:hypothetical protein BDP27DRAFT_1146856, partial [Rhodocollybia butyracea]